MRSLVLISVFALLAVPLLAQKNAKPLTDDEITDQVMVHLANDPDVGGVKFEVTVQNGAVTLKGKVRTDKQKAKAEKVAKKVKGVTSVNNQLVVSPA